MSVLYLFTYTEIDLSMLRDGKSVIWNSCSNANLSYYLSKVIFGDVLLSGMSFTFLHMYMTISSCLKFNNQKHLSAE